MQEVDMLPVQLTIKDIPSSPALESTILKKAKKLTQFYQRITSCRIVVELPKKHQHHGKLFNVRIDVTVPGKELVATKQCEKGVYVAVREAFEAIIRQLESHAQKRNGRVKTHQQPITG